MKRFCLVLGCVVLTSPVLAADGHPAVTVPPGTVSMSGGASHDLIESLGTYLSPQDMQAFRGFLRDALMTSITNKPVVMDAALAASLNKARTQMVDAKDDQAVRSLDTTVGPQMRAALATAKP